MSKVVCLSLALPWYLLGAGPLHGDSHWMRLAMQVQVAGNGIGIVPSGLHVGAFEDNLGILFGIENLFPKACCARPQPACWPKPPDPELSFRGCSQQT